MAKRARNAAKDAADAAVDQQPIFRITGGMPVAMHTSESTSNNNTTATAANAGGKEFMLPSSGVDDAAQWFSPYPAAPRSGNGRSSMVLYGEDDSMVDTRSFTSSVLSSPMSVPQQAMPTLNFNDMVMSNMMMLQGTPHPASSYLNIAFSAPTMMAPAYLPPTAYQLDNQASPTQSSLAMPMNHPPLSTPLPEAPSLPPSPPNHNSPPLNPAITINSGSDSLHAKKPKHKTTNVDEDTVSWLKSNFEIKSGFHVARNAVYKAYEQHMQSIMQEPASAASFGKTIRLVFKSVTSRRLGSRGKSRYHYDGLRVKPSSAAALMSITADDDDAESTPGTPRTSRTPSGHNLLNSSGGAAALAGKDKAADPAATLAELVDKSLTAPALLPLRLSELSAASRSNPAVADDLARLNQAYQRWAQECVELVRAVQFKRMLAQTLELWTGFSEDGLAYLTADPSAVAAISTWNAAVYDALLHVLVPDVLAVLGAAVHSLISSFAEDVLTCAKKVANDVPLAKDVLDVKIKSAERFLHDTQRRLGLNNMANHGAKILQNKEHVDLMRRDLERLNLRGIILDGAAVTGCSEDFLNLTFSDLKKFLEQPRALTVMAAWLESVVTRIMSSGLSKLGAEAGENVNGYTASLGRDLLRNWAYFSSQILREVNTKAVPSAGVMNAVRLLMDEYVCYLVNMRTNFPQKQLKHTPRYTPRPDARDTLSRASNGSVQMETIVQHVSTGLLAPLEIVDEPDGHSSCGETTESSLSSAAASATAAAAVL